MDQMHARAVEIIQKLLFVQHGKEWVDVSEVEIDEMCLQIHVNRRKEILPLALAVREGGERGR